MRAAGPMWRLEILAMVGAALLVGCLEGRRGAADGGGDAGASFESADLSTNQSEREAREDRRGEIAAPGSTEVRSRRRMDIDQLDAALRRVTGGIGWDDYGGDSRFQELAQTLGKPDFAESTKETLTPTAVFEKFLGDAARSVCDDLADREERWSEEGAPEKRHLLVEVDHEATYESAPNKVEKNLQTLLLQFHGRRVERGSPRLDNWRRLFVEANDRADDPVVAWRTVCVALVQHPDFYTY